MGQQTGIAWCDSTFNPWRGCTKISAGCTHCYADTLSKRNPKVLGVWGDNGTRVVASEAAWRDPFKWDRAAAEAGERRRVFCASLADVFEDRPELDGPRARLLHSIQWTEHLDWLLLTKRPGNILPSLRRINEGMELTRSDRGFIERWLGGAPPSNLWLGVSVEDQSAADSRIPILLKTPAAVRFLSVEPLIGPVDLGRWLPRFLPDCTPSIDWVIIGGESGAGARPCDLAWVRSIVARCKAAGVPVFCKQLGAGAVDAPNGVAGRSLGVDPDAAALVSRRLKDSHGGDWDEWPEDLRVRDFPRPGKAVAS